MIDPDGVNFAASGPCTALKLATDAYRSPEQGGLGMTDVSTQYLKLWMGDPRSSGRQCVKTNMIGQIGSPAIEAAASAVGLTKDMVVETIREFMGTSNKPDRVRPFPRLEAVR